MYHVSAQALMSAWYTFIIIIIIIIIVIIIIIIIIIISRQIDSDCRSAKAAF